MLIDAHCHLDMLDIEKAIEGARKNNVNIILANGTNPETNRKVLELSKKYKEVKPVLGIYPVDALKLTDKQIAEEINFIKNSNPFAIGEVGMDFKDDLDNWKRQEKIFEKFVKLSIGLDIPITVHSRKAEKECIEILERLKSKKVIMHYFSGKISLVKRIIENNWMLSIPTAVKNSEHFQKVIEMTPVENLLCETDSPYSHPDKEFPNEPKNVIESYEKIAEIKKLSLEETKNKIEENFQRLFKGS